MKHLFLFSLILHGFTLSANWEKPPHYVHASLGYGVSAFSGWVNKNRSGAFFNGLVATSVARRFEFGVCAFSAGMTGSQPYKGDDRNDWKSGFKYEGRVIGLGFTGTVFLWRFDPEQFGNFGVHTGLFFSDVKTSATYIDSRDSVRCGCCNPLSTANVNPDKGAAVKTEFKGRTFHFQFGLEYRRKLQGDLSVKAMAGFNVSPFGYGAFSFIDQLDRSQGCSNKRYRTAFLDNMIGYCAVGIGFDL